MDAILRDFAKLLEARFTSGILTTEDSVRYTLFASMLYNKIEPNTVILESPHPEIEKAKIDTWISGFHGENIAIEFKYDREPPGGTNQPKTQKAGSVFRDLQRLQLVSKKTSAICYFVYLTTKGMDTYFRNPTNGHQEFYKLEPSHTIDITERYFSGKPQTFTTKLGEIFEATLTGVLKISLPDDHFLRVYKVESS